MRTFLMSEHERWKQRHRDHYNGRKSTARNRCETCSVEIISGRKQCGICHTRERRQGKKIGEDMARYLKERANGH